jgi:hypothetical protein
MENLASTYYQQGQLAEVAALQDSVLAARRRMFGEGSFEMLMSEPLQQPFLRTRENDCTSETCG